MTEDIFNLDDVEFHTEGLESPESIEVLPMDDASWNDWADMVNPEHIEIDDATVLVDVHADDIEIILQNIDPMHIEIIHDHIDDPVHESGFDDHSHGSEHIDDDHHSDADLDSW